MIFMSNHQEIFDQIMKNEKATTDKLSVGEYSTVIKACALRFPENLTYEEGLEIFKEEVGKL